MEQSPEDSGYAMTPGTDQPSRLEDLLQKQNEGIMVGLEEDDTTVQFKEDTSEREKQLGSKDITFEGISELFGRPLEDAAKSFGGRCFSFMFLHFLQLTLFRNKKVIYY